MLGKAIAITAEAFKDKVDKGGEPYIMHCLRVMNGVKHLGEDAMCAAVMHDLIEDTSYNAGDLLREGFNSKVVILVEQMTRKNNEQYDSYIRRVATDPISKAIKLADLKDNSDITRLKGLRQKDFERMEKYHRAFVYLNN